MNIVILLGPPGSGKGTQAEIIKRKFGFTKLSTGDLLRDQITRKTELGLQVKEIMDKGGLVSDEIVGQIVKNVIKDQQGNIGLILDGFPRTLFQAKDLHEYLEEVNEKIIGVIEVIVPDKVILDRLVYRFFCAKCNEAYNKKYKQPKIEEICDICGSSEFKVRDDDRHDTVISRLSTYYKTLEPMKDYYLKNKLLHSIDGSLGINQVEQEITNYMIKLNVKLLT